MTDEERELDLQLGDMIRENHILKRRLEAAVTEALRLRHKLEHIYALSQLAISEDIADREGSEAPITHDDKASY
jgi:hypothetical protein